MPTQNHIITTDRVEAQQRILAELTRTKDALIALIETPLPPNLFTALEGLYGAMCILTKEYGDLLMEIDR